MNVPFTITGVNICKKGETITRLIFTYEKFTKFMSFIYISRPHYNFFHFCFLGLTFCYLCVHNKNTEYRI